jgi:hypothetical protein
MSPPNINDLWQRFLSEELSAAESAELVATLSTNPELRDSALADAEMDGLLRSLGQTSRPGDEDRFVASVIHELEADDADAQQSVVDRPSPPPGMAPVNRPEGTSLGLRIAWSVVAGLAVCLLVAVTVINRSDRDDPLAGSDAQASLPATDPGDPDAAGENQPTLAASDAQIDSQTENRPSQSELSVPSPTELVETISPPPSSPPVLQPSDSRSTGQPISGFAVLVSSSDDVSWYQTPRELTGQSLNLQAGSATFRLASGATISVSGPAQFQIDSPNSLILAAGLVSADVPQEAIGFAVDTPSARVVDLGTRFDVRVAPAGATLVQVAKGKVAVESATGDSGNMIVQASEHQFVEADGSLWNWNIEITANIFGELSGSINGKTFRGDDLTTLQQVTAEIFADQATPGRPDQPMRARYVFNGRVQESDAQVSGAELLKVIERDLSQYKEVVRRAVEDDGSFQVNNVMYVYDNLKEKLEARRMIARIHGPRALGETFLPHEKFETTGDADKLAELQAILNKRLNVDFAAVSLNSRPKRPNTKSRPVEVRQPLSRQHDDSGTAEPSVRPLQETDSRRAAEQRDAIHQLEQIRQRKVRLRQAVPAAGAADDEAANKRDNSTAAADSSSRRADRRANPELDAIVAAALQAELQGDDVKREELLIHALSKHPGHPEANWQLGKVKLRDEWVPIEQAQESAKSSPVLASFDRMRAKHAGSLPGELKLARWCKTYRPETARMYYARLLNHPLVSDAAVRAEAAENLDLIPFAGSYVTEAELKQQEARAQAWQAANRRWHTPLTNWIKWLSVEASYEQKLKAIKQMEDANDPGLVLAAHQFARQGSEVFGVELVHAVDKHLLPESAHLLCKMAMFSPWPAVRLAAVTALKERRLHDYVPDLLGALIGPTHSGWTIIRQSDGSIRYEHFVRHEGARHNQELLTVREAMPVTRFDPQFDRTPPDRETGEQADSEFLRLFGMRGRVRIREWMVRDTGLDTAVRNVMAESAVEQERRVALANQQARAHNARIFQLLTATTEQELPLDAPLWWDWWTDYNEIEIQKSNGRYYDYDEVEFVASTQGIGSRFVPERHSCFTAGTLVATETGMRSIEQIVAGDRVFAKDLKTGELRLQTVLATTIRPAASTLELTIDGKTLRTTVGHPFWVAGEGWRMAKLLTVGDQIHGLEGGSVVEKIRSLPGAEVYNLVVDQFNNYFVGEQMVLAHDNTFRTPAPVRLPGLK